MRAHDDPDLASAKVSVQAAALADIARFEPRTALAEWRALADPATKTTAILPIATSWSQTDPAAAVRWVEEQWRATGAPRGEFPLGVVQAWVIKDRPAAQTWINATPSLTPEQSATLLVPK